MKKNHNRRRLSVWLRGMAIAGLLLFAAVFAPAVVRAQDARVVDTYGLFSAAEKEQLERACARFEEETGIRTAILSIDTAAAGGSSDRNSMRYIEDYADSLNGADFIGLLINMDTRYYYVDVTGNEALRIFTDSRQEQLGQAVVDRLASGRYAEAGTAFLNMAAQQYSYARANQSYGTIREEESGFRGGVLGAAAAVAAAISGAITGVRSRSHSEKKLATEANRYIVPGTVNFHKNSNVFVSQYVTRVPIVKEKSGGGGGGFTTIHTSGGGHSHSGHGGHF